MGLAVLLALLPAAPAAAQDYHVRRLVGPDQLHLPVYATSAPGDDQHLFVVQLGGLASHETDDDPLTSGVGKIMVLNRNTGQVNAAPFLELPETSLVDPVTAEPEVGLWALAFHPDYQNNGRFFINVAVDTPAPGPFSSMIREYSVSADPVVANPMPTKTVMQVDQPAFNHNGSWIGFNPIANEANDGQQYLYITLGDGGDQHDPRQYGQSVSEVFGSVLRIDVDSPPDPGLNYHIPESNPFVGVEDAAEEVWNYGLRNPWQASFDRETGDLWISDVGQGSREEINFQPADSTGGENYGWRLREGAIATPTGGIGGERPPGAVDPVYDYPHFGQGEDGFEGNSVAGGRLYRGPSEDLQGLYIFADSRSGEVWSFDPADPYGSVTRLKQNPAFTPDQGAIDYVVSFGEDNQGNLLIVDYDGEIFQVSKGIDVTLTVNRDTGEMTFANDGGEAAGFVGYRLFSSAGAVHADSFTPIAGNYDVTGDGSVDPNNAWLVTSLPNSTTAFSEESTGDQAVLEEGESFQLGGAGSWIPSIYEDHQLDVTLADGTVAFGSVEFVGNGGNPFQRSDLDFDGQLTIADWPIFRDNNLTDLSGFSKAERYGRGDLDGDGDNDIHDFRIFKSDFNAANGVGAFQSEIGAVIPEPATAVMLLLGVASCCLTSWPQRGLVV